VLKRKMVARLLPFLEENDLLSRWVKARQRDNDR
jgi:hypothetical protein